MDELAAEAGITKPILYSHFGDKRGLADALAERVAHQLSGPIRAALGQDSEPSAIVRSTIGSFCSFIEAEPELYRFLVQSAAHPSTRSASKLVTGIASEISVVLGRALRQAGVDSGGAEAWSYAIVGMTIGGAGWWLERGSMAKDDMVDYLSQLLWGGLSSAGLDRLEGAGTVAEPAPGETGGNVTHLPGRPPRAAGD
jgi:AcrR family transcriptional regulator